MAREFNRSDRVADAIQRSLAAAIPREIGDPRVGMVNINTVEVARDLSQAKVYVTFVGEDNPKHCADAVVILNRAANFLRNIVSRDIAMRSVPRIQFFYDESALRGQHLSRLIDDAIARDRSPKQNTDNIEE